MICAWCERSINPPDALPLVLTPHWELFARYLPEIGQKEVWCTLCRTKVAILIERVLDAVRKKIPIQIRAGDSARDEKKGTA